MGNSGPFVRTHLVTSVLLLCVFTTSIVRAQDVIVKRNGEEVKAKIIEVAPSAIRYKRFDHMAGPDYIANPADVLLLRYANGSTDTIRYVGEAGARATAPVPRMRNTTYMPKPVPLLYVDGAFYRYEQRLMPFQVKGLIKQNGDADARSILRKLKFRHVLVLAGVPLMVAGGVAITLRGATTRSGNRSLPSQGTIIAGVGTGLTVASIIYRLKGVQLQAAVEAYNASVKSNPAWVADTVRLSPATLKTNGVDLSTQYITRRGPDYVRGTSRISDVSLIIHDGANPEAMEKVIPGVRKKRAAYTMLRVGIGLTGVGAFGVLGGMHGVYRTYGADNTVFTSVAAGLMVSGAALLSNAIIQRGAAKWIIYRAVRIHNDAITEANSGKQ